MTAFTEGPLDHVLRARLPWRTDDLTECGRPAADVASFITEDELRSRVKNLGQQRTAFTVCMTCAGRIDRHRPGPTWETNPLEILIRELERVRSWSGVPGVPRYRQRPEHARMTAELRALAALAAAHPDEFAGYLSGLDATVDLASRRHRPRYGNSL